MKSLLCMLSFLCGTSSVALATEDSANIVILDVRTIEEYQSSHIQGSVHIDMLKSDFKDKVAELDKSKSYKLYCRSGNRSGQALRTMQSLGFEKLENLGSLQQAAKKLNKPCEGPSSC